MIDRNLYRKYISSLKAAQPLRSIPQLPFHRRVQRWCVADRRYAYSKSASTDSTQRIGNPHLKKITRKQRERDVRRSLHHRKFGYVEPNRGFSRKSEEKNQKRSWLLEKIESGEVQASLDSQNRVFIVLPQEMNFSTCFESTSIHLAAIRYLADVRLERMRKISMGGVVFDHLRKISSSAALVLTAELCRWNDSSHRKLRADIERWHPEILNRLYQLGFFGLLQKPANLEDMVSNTNSDVRWVEYIRGSPGERDKTLELRNTMAQVLGEPIDKWTFLNSGLSEAITNVGHHAYPEGSSVSGRKFWYLTGSMNPDERTLKFAFYDQGVGIPNSLPNSEIWERVLGALSFLPEANRKLDEVLLKAAIEVKRTSTGQSDRGEGLNDLLTFIDRRGEGYLSILSGHGLYKYTRTSDGVTQKSERFRNPIKGTLIIWKVTLNDA